MDSATSLALSSLAQIRDLLAHTRLIDRPRLSRELERLARHRRIDADHERAVAKLAAQVQQSIEHVQRLKSLPLRLDSDPELPITAHRDEIERALLEHQVIVVCGATGSGKTTQLPKICLHAGRGAAGMIGHTQPRRIAARALADRLAAELGTSVGAAVGYQVRFNDRTGPDTRVKLMTDGILLREVDQDRDLRRYDTLILDEAHERSLNIDFLLGILKRLLPRRPELRLIVTSATIDPQRFADFFDGAPIIEVSGRSYPVEVRYRPLQGDADERELSLGEGVLAAVRELDRDPQARGDVLVFLPGEKQIRETADILGTAHLPDTEILPLYSRLSTREQERIFERHSARRIVLATNVAETSLTVPGIRNVIDSGLARISRYSVRGKVQRLPIEPISQASADQRKGRCGRERPGICIRLYSEEDFNLRPAFTPPEVLRTNLASVILQMAVLHLGTPDEFPFLDSPDTRQINDGYRLLQELKAVDERREVTALGRQIASLPLDPRLARMLLAASHQNCLREMLVIAAFLSIQDPRDRLADAQAQADAQHAQFADPRSDFVTVLNLWKAYQAQSEALSRNLLRRWCRDNFLSYMRMREWQDLHAQLADMVGELKLRLNQVDARYDELHQALLTGFLGNIGTLDERREYQGARGMRFVIAPGTPLASKPPKWVVAGSLVETTRLYARMVAAIEPQWIEAAGAHLLKRSYAEPHWVEDRGFVAAFESTALYGLTLRSRRRVNFASVEPEEARRIFVREALVERHSRLRTPALEHNAKVRAEVETMEAKVRRRDILIDDDALVEFYLARLPAHVHSVAAFERWCKDNPQADSALRATRSDFMRRGTPEINDVDYPDTWEVAGNRLPLRYRFEPGAADDGVTLVVPEPLLNAVDAGRLAWLIPGWRVEKITAVLRALPKELRKQFVPVPDHARQAANELDPETDFFETMARWISRRSGRPISRDAVAALEVPEYLRMNLRVTDLSGKVLSESRELSRVRRATRNVIVAAESTSPPKLYRAWEFGDLPDLMTVERAGVKYITYPALQDRGTGVVLCEAQSQAEAQRLTRAGVLRLLLLAMPEQYQFARKCFADRRELVLLGQLLPSTQPLPDALASRAFEEVFLPDGMSLPRNKREFDRLRQQNRSNLGDAIDKLIAHTLTIATELRSVRQALDGAVPASVRADVEAQLQVLLPCGYPQSVPTLLWPHLPRYIKALHRRLQKLAGNSKRDQELSGRLRRFVTAAQQLASDPARPRPDVELERLLFMIEEFRVSLFAQDLKTAVPVSDKRLQAQLDKARAAGR
jgi:ATP-dependent helicase HrpA